MNKTIIVFAVLLIFNITKSQDIIDLYAQEITKCTDARVQSIEKVSNEQLDLFINICTRDIYNGRLQSILNYYKLDKEKKDTFDSFYIDVLERTLNTSKSTTEVSDIKILEPIVNDTIINNEDRTPIYLEPIKITIIDIEQKKFPTFIGKDKYGKIQEFIYLKPFPTDIMYRYRRILPGDKFLISYNIIDIFDEDINDFITYRYVYQLIKQ